MKKLRQSYYKTIKRIRKIWFKVLIVVLISSFIKFYFPMDILNKINDYLAIFLATVVGSLSMGNPSSGYIIASALKDDVAVGFLLAWVLVGINSLPLEIEYFGKRYAILRNTFGFIVSLVGALLYKWF